MKVIDLNADIGEADTPDWRDAEAQIVRAISSANIACGGHRGDDESMNRTVENAQAHGVRIGAHPAFPDPENFGRRSLKLGTDISATGLRDSLTAQIARLAEICAAQGAELAYVKPHGALYNDSVADAELADLVAQTVAAIDPNLVFLGGPNSHMGKAAARAGLRFVAEGFIDRRYTDDGHLLSRTIDGAVIQDQAARLAQVRSLATTGEVQTATGRALNIRARSLCVHGDSAGAVQTAMEARAVIEALGVQVEAFA